MKKTWLFLAAAALIGGAGVAFAQLNPPLSIEQQMSQGDVVQVIPGGVPQRSNTYVNAGQVGAMLNEEIHVPLTAFSITPANTTTFLVLNPAGTLATGTITFPAAPSDGGLFCWMSTQTQTAVTMTANTGQSIVGTSVTAGTAGTQYCWRYLALTTTWYRQQ